MRRSNGRVISLSSAVMGSIAVGSAHAPEMTMRPRGRSAGWQAWSSSGRPTHSITASYAPGSACAADANPSVAPSTPATRRRPLSGSATLTRPAPFRSAHTRVVNPTPPAPTMRTSSPAEISALCTPCRPTANGSTNAEQAVGNSAGTANACRAGTAANSANPPAGPMPM